MSSEFYFEKWKQTLIHLEDVVRLDLEHQNTKVLDKRLCAAVMRLTGILGRYIQLYNDTMECFHQNLQVQKSRYMADVVKAITKRILELKHHIRKLECSEIQFMGQGLIDHKLTPFDVELSKVPPHSKRPDHIQFLIEEAFRKAAERKQEIFRLAKNKEQLEDIEVVRVANWWDDEYEDKERNSFQGSIKQEQSEEKIIRRQMAAMIQAHERSRQVIKRLTHERLKRQMWEKELRGTLKPQAYHELKERSAKLIQKALRAYFDIKRRKILQCKEAEILGMQLCGNINKDTKNQRDQEDFRRIERKKQYEQEWITSCENLKEKFMESKFNDLTEDCRDFVRSWFRKWFDDIKYFHDIPRESEGGSVLIMKDELLDPVEWWEDYERCLAEKKSKQNQSALQRKYAEMQAKEEAMVKKREEMMKKKLEAELKRKLMKNPTLHPGYHYPQSEKTDDILEVIKCYYENWSDLDLCNRIDVKEKFVHEVDINNVYAEVKREVMKAVDNDMRNELKLLKKALKTDYDNMEEKMSEPMNKKKERKQKINKKIKSTMSERIAEELEDLAVKDILKQYPRTELKDFLGDHNYAGDDIRCDNETAHSFNGELRTVWWERCREVTHGSHQVLIVGPPLSGKSALVNTLASVNDAALFVMDPNELHTLSTAELHLTVNSVISCARVVQPCVIYIRHVHKLYYKKIPPGESIRNPNILRRILIRKLCKRIHRTDNITIIGTCIDPWMTNSKQLLKQFHNIVLIPDTSYSTVVTLLKVWIDSNHSVPRDLDISGLAFVLRGYSYGYLKDTLIKFLTPERVIKIAAHGLFPQEIYDYIINDSGTKVAYDKYLKWHYEQTHWGIKEKKHINEQKEFKETVRVYKETMKKKIQQKSGTLKFQTQPEEYKLI